MGTPKADLRQRKEYRRSIIGPFSTSSTYKLLIKTEMLAAFSERPASIVGKPTMKELIRVLRHLIDASQSHQYEANDGLNLLHICLPEVLYRVVITDPTVQAYPQ